MEGGGDEGGGISGGLIGGCAGDGGGVIGGGNGGRIFDCCIILFDVMLKLFGLKVTTGGVRNQAIWVFT